MKKDNLKKEITNCLDGKSYCPFGVCIYDFVNECPNRLVNIKELDRVREETLSDSKLSYDEYLKKYPHSLPPVVVECFDGADTKKCREEFKQTLIKKIEEWLIEWKDSRDVKYDWSEQNKGAEKFVKYFINLIKEL